MDTLGQPLAPTTGDHLTTTLESAILERLPAPQEAHLFEKFDELSRVYALEPPYLPRTQLGLAFELYDGHRIQGAGGEHGDSLQLDAAPLAAQRAASQAGLPSSMGAAAAAAIPASKGLRRMRHRIRLSQPWLKLRRSNCLGRSETHPNQLSGLSSSASGASLYASTATTTTTTGACREESTGADLDSDEEAQQLVNFLFSSRKTSNAFATAAAHQLDSQQQPALLELAGIFPREVSVCLFRKGRGSAPLQRRAEGARRLAHLQLNLRELVATINQQHPPKPELLTRWADKQAERLAERLSSGQAAFGSCSKREPCSRPHQDQLIKLAKLNLSQLIDAQLLLRNKFSNANNNSEQQLYHTEAGEHWYDQLLRNNFNLLKIWQNLEETPRLACFVCEPIKTSLADLFWLTSHRMWWNQSTSSSCAHHNHHQCLLQSPLLCLDQSQVKRGLIQILEALQYLHSVCKLIHRNLSPRNILVAAGDNWKLAGLEFAVRFESTAVAASDSLLVSDKPMAYASGASLRAPLRRQRTLHQTRCEQFRRGKRAPKLPSFLQPELEYLAPEIWQRAECSHKSDLFSFGLLLLQTYDIPRHRSPLGHASPSKPATYELQLKKLLDERRKRQLARFVPTAMRPLLLEMVQLEPNMRPSANYALQLFRRPIELCESNEDSLRHLRSSLGYLQQQQQQQQQPHNINNLNGSVAHKKRINYFRKVTSNFRPAQQWHKPATSMADQRAALSRQTKNIRLLNLILSALQETSAANANAIAQANAPGTFDQLRQQFESTFEGLGRLYRLGPGEQESQQSLLLSIAMHRRLLDQVLAMRRELPQISRLVGAQIGRRLSANHRLLAELEERLHWLVSKHSIGRLAQVLTDPLVKLDEFLLTNELLNDLLAFVGQKSRQSFLQRARQLLNELTPITGRPLSLSSSSDDWDEDDEKADEQLHHLDYQRDFGEAAAAAEEFEENEEENEHQRMQTLQDPRDRAEQQQQQHQQHQQQPTSMSSSSYNRHNQQSAAYFAGSDHQESGWLGRSPSGGSGQVHRGSNCDQLRHAGSRDSLINESRNAAASRLVDRHRHSDFPTAPNHQHQHQNGDQNSSKANSGCSRGAPTNNSNSGSQRILFNQQQQQQQQQQQYLPTKISIIGPSPAGSLREMDQLSQAELMVDPCGAPTGRQQQQQQQQKQHEIIADQLGQLSLCTSAGNNSSNRFNSRQQDASAQSGQVVEDDFSSQHEPPASKSRSQLIDELLQTINDDSFNDLVVFTNSSSAASQTHQHHQTGANSDLARPKSASDSSPGAAHSSYSASGRPQSSSQEPQLQHRPNSLNLAGQQQAPRQQQHQQQPASTFDNVIRRMSTNLVQNFNKISSSNLGGTTTGAASNQEQLAVDAASLQRGKSSTPTNSLYVDNQVPVRRHSDNTINIPRIQVALSSPQASHSPRPGNLNQRASLSASKLANKWKVNAKSSRRESGDKLSPNLAGALGYMRRHSSGNTAGGAGSRNEQSQSNGHTSSSLFNTSPFKTRSSSNLGLDFLLSNRSMKRRCSAASMLGHQTQRKAEDLIDAGMKSVQNMFS